MNYLVISCLSSFVSSFVNCFVNSIESLRERLPVLVVRETERDDRDSTTTAQRGDDRSSRRAPGDARRGRGTFKRSAHLGAYALRHR